MRSLGAVVLCVAAACGGDGTELAGSPDAARDHASVDARRDAPAPRDAGRESRPEAAAEAGHVYPSGHPPMPLVKNQGGPVLAHPRIVPVFWSADPLMSTIETFLASLTTATYWAGATAEYGVGPLVVTAPVIVPGTPPAVMSDANIQALVRGHLHGETTDAGAGMEAGAPWPTPDAGTIYALFFAAATSIQFAGVESCTSFAGYHGQVSSSGGPTAYAVMPRCATFPLLPGKGTMDILTVATTHELAEAVTDPYPFTNPAYVTADYAGSGWSEVSVGGEVGDMCVLEASSFTTPADVGFLVQRVWSNANAATSRDPCAPAPPGEVYFNAVPVLSKTEMNPGFFLDGVPVAPGASASTTLFVFSDGKTTGPIALDVTEAGEKGTRIPPDPRHQLSFSLDRATAYDGDTVTLTIHRKPLASGEMPSGLGFRITATVGAATHSYFGVAGYD